MPNYINTVVEWLNENQGILAVALFAITAMYGWFSGIFSALQRRPKFKIDILPGPTFATVFGTGRQHAGFATHRTCVAIYLRVTNVGSAPASIGKITIGYHWSLRPLSRLWIKYSIGWFRLRDQTAAIQDFQVKIGENIKIYPFLTQRSAISGSSAETYLEIGRSTNGVVYFEQSESYGGCFPHAFNWRIKTLLEVTDSFGRRHKRKFWLPRVTLSAAREYNPSFGLTLSALHEEDSPIELDTDGNGNIK